MAHIDGDMDSDMDLSAEVVALLTAIQREMTRQDVQAAMGLKNNGLLGTRGFSGSLQTRHQESASIHHRIQPRYWSSISIQSPSIRLIPPHPSS